MNRDVVLNKTVIIERCLKRIGEEYGNNPENLANFTKQDSMILNIQRACEAAIDIGMHVVSQKKLGVPQTSRETFDLLEENGMIEAGLCKGMKAMIGFRNIAVHDYQELNLEIVQKIIEVHLNDFKTFSEQILKII